jgi:hypothetical protein
MGARTMGKASNTYTFKGDDEFDKWLAEQRKHQNLTELGLSELIRTCLKIGIPMLQTPPCFADTLCEFHTKSQS